MLYRPNENVMAAEQNKVLVRSLVGEAVNQPAQPITLFRRTRVKGIGSHPPPHTCDLLGSPRLG
jgi:hypothetical protein